MQIYSKIVKSETLKLSFYLAMPSSVYACYSSCYIIRTSTHAFCLKAFRNFSLHQLISYNFLAKGWPTNKTPRAIFHIVLLRRGISYAWAHMNIAPSFPHSYTFTQLDLLYINITTEQHIQ